VKRTTYTLTLLALVLAAALAMAGCGSGDDNGSGTNSARSGYGSSSGEGGTTSEEAPAGAESGAAVITLSSAKGVGPVLVDAKGFTVYDFHKDEGATSSCYGACAKGWPPVLTEGPPTAGEGAAAAKLGTTERKDGTTQVTYAGHPLYTFVEDRKPGEANGNNVDAFGAEWYALQGSGEDAEG
jgi:predicted lipoprotein with Yx(FWY)xxD motif